MQPYRPYMIDLFCGLKGASQAMREHNWRIETVDINPDFAPDICADISRMDWCPVGQVDLVWASPPCEDFTRRFLPWLKGKHVDPPTRALELVEAAKRLIRVIKPRYWVIENVRGAIPWLGSPDQTAGPFMLWTNLPPLGMEGLQHGKERMSGDQKAERAKVPYELSDAERQAVEEGLRQGVLPLKEAPTPAWVRCDCCGDCYCTIHDMHTGDCACPPIEEWEVDPYLTGGAA